MYTTPPADKPVLVGRTATKPDRAAATPVSPVLAPLLTGTDTLFQVTPLSVLSQATLSCGPADSYQGST